MATNNYKRTPGRARTSIDQLGKLTHCDSPVGSENLPPRLPLSDEPPRFSSKKSATSRMSADGPSGRMKLRDYLFLANTRAKKLADQKKNEDLDSPGLLKPPEKVMTRRQSRQQLRKAKYGMDNAQMFAILRDQMEQQLSQQIQRLIEVKEGVCNRSQQGPPMDGEMGAMYALRALMKDKLTAVVTEMRDVFMRGAASSGSLPTFFTNDLDVVMEEDDLSREGLRQLALGRHPISFGPGINGVDSS